MSIVSVNEIQSSLHLDRFGPLGHGLSNLIMKSTGLDALNEKYNQYKHLDCKLFLDEAIDILQLSYQIPETDLERIPREGPFVTISNHPLGGADGMILMKLLSDIRPDFKVMGNYLLHKIEPLQPMIFPVDPFDENQGKKQNVNGLREIIRFIAEGKPIGIFPAGEVSTYQKGEKQITDREWSASAMKLIKRLNIPVIPIYFHARNSELFYQLAKLSPKLRTAKLPSELLKQHGRLIRVRIGQPITVEKQEKLVDINEYSEYLRGKTYLLEHSFSEKKKKKKVPSPVLSIVSERPPLSLSYEIAQLQNQLLFTHQSIECYFTQLQLYSNLLREIARLREITFRTVGEGTNQATDTDIFDTYYHHLFLWDKESQSIIGAYRIGLGKTIYATQGKKGFYLNQLFKFDRSAQSLLSHSIEMGRAFVIEAYQKKPMSLFLLWKGIALITLRYPEYKYIIGSVSISDKFSEFSKALMVSFIHSNYFDAHWAQWIKARKQYKIRLKKKDQHLISAQYDIDLQELDRLIDEIEPGGLRLPILLKKYIKQNGRIVSFSIDPKFNDALDAFMYIKIKDIPEATMKPALQELGRQTT